MHTLPKRALAVACAAALLGTGTSALAAESVPASAPSTAISVQLDGRNLSFPDAAPEARDGRTFLPVRTVFEAMGAEVSYSPAAQTITAFRDGTTVTMALGGTTATVERSGVTTHIPMDAAPYAHDNRTYVPVRFAAQAFGCAVGWDAGDRTVILSFGGSLGAQVLGERVADLAKWEIAQRDFLHVHATGSIEKADFAALAARLGIDHSPKFIIREYIDNMPELLAAADLVISRAGALTLAEIAAVGRASVLIPSPNVAENHQYHNAMQLQKLGAAVVVEEKELTGEKLIGIVDKLTKDPAELMLMGAKARALAQPDSLDKICENLDRLMKTTA